MKYTQIPVDTFETLQMNAGILATGFDPTTGTVTGIIGATTGGISFTDSMSFIDLGEDIDNCPKNMMELKQIDQREVTMSGTFVTVKAATAKMLAIADTASGDDTKIIPRNDLLETDFSDIWFIGDYSDKNTGEDAGFIAIKLINALNTGGFALTTGDKAKGQFAFTFTGHYSMAEQDRVPYEIYINGGSGVQPSVTIQPDIINLVNGGNVTVEPIVVPAGTTVTFTTANSSVATVNSDGKVTAAGVGNTILTASITVDGVTYSDTATIVVTAAQGT